MKKTLKSGATLDITRSPFVIGHKLFKVVTKEVKENVDLKLGLKGQTLGNLGEFEATDEALNTIKDAFMTVLSSQEIEDVLWECMARVTYNDQKVTIKLFDDEAIQEDFFEVFKEVAMYNLIPFGKSLASLFPDALVKRFTNTPASK